MLEGWIIKFGDYTWIFSLLIFELIFAIVLIMNYSWIRLHAKHYESHKKGQQIYEKIIGSSLPQMHILLEHERRYPVFMSQNVEKLIGVSQEMLQSDFKRILDHMSQIDQKKFVHLFESWDRKESVSMEYFLFEQKKWYQLTIVCSSDPAYDLFVFEDITKLKEKEEIMNEKLLQAESISQAKTTFLSRMSHEIRTPMNGISGMLALIDSQPHNESITQYLQKAHQLSDYLLSLINDILDMSRIENNKLELEEKPFDIYDVADEIRVLFQKTVENKGVEFHLETSDFPDHYVIGDRLRFTQVIINFVSNAAKFTNHGEVRVTFRQMMSDEGNVNFMVRVHDTGTGMDPSFVEHIFNPFEQENASISHQYGGSGLGMAITNQIVKQMNGEIVIDTMKGVGSDFSVYLTLPIAKRVEVVSESPVTEREEVDFTFTGLHILMAEDNEINAEIASTILTKMGATVDVASDGQIALEMFKRSKPGTYDFILMDIQMPNMDGRTATKAIRHSGCENAKTIPIFALSADAFVEDQRLSAAAGMNGHFVKPIDFEELRKGIGQYMMRQKNNGGDRL